MKKTITEWNGYILLTEKKIDKLVKELMMAPFIVTTKGIYELDKAIVDKKVDRITAISEAIVKLQHNVTKIKSARREANATHTVLINGKPMHVATAIDMFIKRRATEEMIYKFERMAEAIISDRKRANDKYLHEKEKIERELTSSTRPISEKERAYALERIQEQEPKEFNPLDLEVFARDQREKFNIFLTEANVQLNIFNATTFLDVELDID